MLDYITSLKIICIFEILFVSLLGFGFPLYLLRRNAKESSASHSAVSNESNSQVSFVFNEEDDISNSGRDILQTTWFLCLKCLSTGIILGVAFMHLLPDASDALESQDSINVQGYPVVFGVTLLGVCFMFLIEHGISVHLCFSAGSHMKDKVDETQLSDRRSEEQQVEIKHNHDIITDEEGGSVVEMKVLSCPQCNIELEEQFGISEEVVKENSYASYESHKSYIKALIMEFSIAIHSFIIGLSYGLLGSQAGDLATIQALMIAFVPHQFFEGVSLGSAFMLTNIPYRVKTYYAIFFSLTLPTGIILGMFTSESSQGDAFKGFANAFAAGCLIYTSLVEMAAEDFHSQVLDNRSKSHYTKLQMVLSLWSGIGIMALLAIWA